MLTVCASTLFLSAWMAVSGAHARVDGATPIAGPDAAVVELADVAMAEDGTGGVVFRRFEGGYAHVYAARYDGGRWHPPQRVDQGQRFESVWPRIGAANDGKLVVTWVQDGGAGYDSLWSATLPRRSGRFLAPTLVDYTVGEAGATYPSLAMAPGGNALLSYRVVTRFAGADLPPGSVRSETRLARFDGWRWQRFGSPVERNRSLPQRQPTANNSAQVAILPDGRGAIAWQEPDESFVERIWTRRIFGNRTGFPQQASPAQVAGQPVIGDADALAIDATPFGRIVVAARQQPNPRDRTVPPRIYVNAMPESTDDNAARFAVTGPRLADGAGDRPTTAPGPPAVSLGGRIGLLVSFARAGGIIVGSGDDDAITTATQVGDQPDGAPPFAIDAAAAGRGVVAYASSEGGGRVIVRQLDGAQPTATQAVAGPQGGPVRSIAVAGSGTGDALVAFAQGNADEGQIAVARVHASPVPFTVLTSPDWSRSRRPLIRWDPPPPGFRPRSYTVELDGRAVARTRRDGYRFREGTLPDGIHQIRVVATNSVGETTATDTRPLQLDRVAPAATAVRSGRSIVVRIDDGRAGEVSGPAPESSTIRWGDGRSDEAVTDRATHRYRRAGTYRVVVRAMDAAGNVETIRLSVRAPAGRARSRARPRRRPTTKEQR